MISSWRFDAGANERSHRRVARTAAPFASRKSLQGDTHGSSANCTQASTRHLLVDDALELQLDGIAVSLPETRNERCYVRRWPASVAHDARVVELRGEFEL